MVVLTIGLFLIWTKLEIITERMNEENQYQRLVNTETTKDITELIKELKLTQKHQEKPESTPPAGISCLSSMPPTASISCFSDYHSQLNSEEILYNDLGPFGDLDDITDEEYEDSETDLIEQLQALPMCRTKL